MCECVRYLIAGTLLPPRPLFGNSTSKMFVKSKLPLPWPSSINSGNTSQGGRKDLQAKGTSVHATRPGQPFDPMPRVRSRIWFQVDVYSILAKATPAEIGSALHGRSGAEVGGDPKLPKKSRTNKRAWGSAHRVETSGDGEQRLIKAGLTPTVEYLARDPLGDEVALLDAILQENARR